MASLAERLRNLPTATSSGVGGDQSPVATDPLLVPPRVRDKLKRGRAHMKRDAAKRRLCQRFERGETYYYLTGKGVLTSQSTVTNPDGTGKPPHRIRNSYNLIRPIVQGKVSAATQRVPSYEILPSSSDPTRVGAAKLAEQVAYYGYDKWRVREATGRVVQYAIGGGGEGFAMAYFDPNVGPYREVDGQMVGEGEIKIITLNGNEVYWEPNVAFNDSAWHAIERALPIDEVKEMPGFDGRKLVADASSWDIPNDNDTTDNMVVVTKFFERPCPEYPEGRQLVIANDRQIVPEERYPVRDPAGNAVDEPVLLRLAWDVGDGKDRELGLTWQLVDSQRTYQDAMNKASEWKNRCLVPQLIAATNSLLNRPTDEPGAVIYYQGLQPPTWERVQEIPESLFRIAETASSLMMQLGADQQFDAAPNVAAATVQAVIEQSQARWARFVGDLADFHSRLMRQCLNLVGCYYTEPRLLSINGRGGPYLVKDFQGAQLLGEIDVRVLPGSLDYMTRAQVTSRVLAYADRGWITPQQAMLAIDRGTAESLVQSTELDVARVQRIIQKVRDGTVMDMSVRAETDPTTGAVQEVPAWMPMDMVDDLGVWRHEIGDFMKTYEFEQLPPDRQEVAKLIIAGLDKLQMTAAQRQADAQNAQAQALGMANATRPTAKQMPSLPGGTGPGPEAAPPGQ